MINKRLIQEVPESKAYIFRVVLLQLLDLFLSLGSTGTLILLLRQYMVFGGQGGIYFCLVAGILILVRFFLYRRRQAIAYEASVDVKKLLRQRIFQKLMGFGTAYREKVKTAEAVQIMTEGVDQLEIYFSAYLPQFFYSMMAPLVLFGVIAYFSLKVAIILLLGVPLIPLAIVLVQKFAKRTFAKYWGRYTEVGDQFLENLQGLTTLKIYQADGRRHDKMNRSAEAFRVATMRVLTMQLNSIIIMDLVAYGGAAFALTACIGAVQSGNLDLYGALFILFLSADYFLPMRQLGSFFHVAMNGMAAADKMFDLLDLEGDFDGTIVIPGGSELTLSAQDLSFSYPGGKKALGKVFMDFKGPGLIGVAGLSGSGKSTLATLLSKQIKGYQGSLRLFNQDLSAIKESSLLDHVTYLGAGSYLMAGRVRDLLNFARPGVEDEKMWEVLDRVNLREYFEGGQGLDSLVESGGSNLSGGQRQRLSLAMALLRESEVYLFDEVTSNIDVESEEHIVSEIYALAKKSLVIFISHRLANIQGADMIYVLDQGEVKEEGSQESLMARKGIYAALWDKQAALEAYRGEEKYA